MAENPDYVFTRDYIDNNRINLQHYLWVELFGYLTHPNIRLLEKAHSSTESKPLRVADVGTGTAIWLTDLGARLPHDVQLDGLDVSFNAAPPASWLPRNVTLRNWDIKEPAPAELIGAYDLVHIRNFAFVLQDAEIPSILDKLIALLKPGGYIQWGEPDVASFRIEKTEASNKVEALTGLLALSQGQDARLKPTWVPGLARSFELAGLEQMHTDVRDAPPHLALAMHECNLTIHELIARQTGKPEIAKALAQMMSEVGVETRNGACWAFTRWTIIGRKQDEV
ncbi:umta methyltransferase family protein [Pyrenophora tritici-repentis]|uniref:Methyltransferase domain containing protein n=1 Tax=Pyrenophora tritici-repentis TaxID=45151 RepID=A0A2W1HS95_9PLEO|nr:Methyltransferase domain protein [Pyrenophora tritici-repentis]KAF7442275.1 Methyltransferase domain protein [Pyrenophora tritici-repentis]KAG9378274.1 Methyltransferase domain protein [Pyrenophora tritici-repentis]KAI0584417.1 Methyltransferase domain protein [Pyrenophora tritici-repentis]KAI0588843.1 Methyltransferase domain protein [Pyrenophora tritici-repentis]